MQLDMNNTVAVAAASSKVTTSAPSPKKGKKPMAKSVTNLLDAKPPKVKKLTFEDRPKLPVFKDDTTAGEVLEELGPIAEWMTACSDLVAQADAEHLQSMELAELGKLVDALNGAKDAFKAGMEKLQATDSDVEGAIRKLAQQGSHKWAALTGVSLTPPKATKTKAKSNGGGTKLDATASDALRKAIVDIVNQAKMPVGKSYIMTELTNRGVAFSANSLSTGYLTGKKGLVELGYLEPHGVKSGMKYTVTKQGEKGFVAAG